MILICVSRAVIAVPCVARVPENVPNSVDVVVVVETFPDASLANTNNGVNGVNLSSLSLSILNISVLIWSAKLLDVSLIWSAKLLDVVLICVARRLDELLV